jgi:hypothetical protein
MRPTRRRKERSSVQSWSAASSTPSGRSRPLWRPGHAVSRRTLPGEGAPSLLQVLNVLLPLKGEENIQDLQKAA